MKKFTSLVLALILALSISAGAFASMPETAGSPVFKVSTIITPGSLTVYQNQSVTFTAITTFTSNKSDNQWLHFVSDGWTGVDVVVPTTENTPATGTPLTIVAAPAAAPNERLNVFTATAPVFVSSVPGEHVVYVTYTITLQHDFSGKRTYETTTKSATVTIIVLPGTAGIVLPGTADAEVVVVTPTYYGWLNHGQIVSAWAHWKQTKGNENFLAGGPGVDWSLVWYKAQVEYRQFTSVWQVYAYLDSIYELRTLHMNYYDNDNNDDNDYNDNNDNNGNNGKKDKNDKKDKNNKKDNNNKNNNNNKPGKGK